MKILLFITLFGQQVYAGSTLNEGKALKCLRQLLPSMQEYTYEVPNRTTIMHMFKDGWGGGTYSNEIRSGVLLVERNQVRVCSFEWNIGEINYFRAEDSAGKIWYSFEKGKAMPFRESSSWTASYKKPACRNVTEDTDAQKFVTKIVSNTLIAKNADTKQEIPLECRSLVRQENLEDALKRVKKSPPPTIEPSATIPTNAEGT